MTEKINPICPTTGEVCATRKAFIRVSLDQEVQITGRSDEVRETGSKLVSQTDQNFHKLFSIGEQFCETEDCGLQALASVVTLRRASFEQAMAEIKETI